MVFFGRLERNGQVRDRRQRTDSDASKFSAVRADPGYGVAADPPLVFLHAGHTNLETAVAGPAKLLLLATAMTGICLPSFFPTLWIPLHRVMPWTCNVTSGPEFSRRDLRLYRELESEYRPAL